MKGKKSRKVIKKSLGVHLLVELEECDLKLLEDFAGVKRTLLDAARVSGATVVDSVFHKFNPMGISGVVVIAESHISIHTWPEHRYAAVDVFTCSNAMQPMAAVRHIAKHLCCRRRSVTVRKMTRGIYHLSQKKKPSTC